MTHLLIFVPPIQTRLGFLKMICIHRLTGFEKSPKKQNNVVTVYENRLTLLGRHILIDVILHNKCEKGRLGSMKMLRGSGRAIHSQFLPLFCFAHLSQACSSFKIAARNIAPKR